MVRMNLNVNTALIGIFTYLVIDNTIKRMLEGRFHIAILTYILIGSIIYIAHMKFNRIRFKPIFWRFLIAWLPMAWFVTIEEWVTKNKKVI